MLTLSRARVRELEVRERIAMIERGLVPAPEVDPRGFDRAMSRLERHEYRHGSGRHQRAGVTLMGVGFGLMVLIGIAFESPSAGFGVGGFLVIMGMAFFINSRFEQPRDGAPPANSRSTSSLKRSVSLRIQPRHPYRYKPAAPIHKAASQARRSHAQNTDPNRLRRAVVQKLVPVGVVSTTMWLGIVVDTY